MMVFEAKVDHKKIDKVIDTVYISPSFNKNTRLMMNNETLNALCGRHFYDERLPKYNGIRLIQDESLSLGEIVVLTQFV